MNNLEEAIITKTNKNIAYKNKVGQNVINMIMKMNNSQNLQVTDQLILNTKIFKVYKKNKNENMKSDKDEKNLSLMDVFNID